MWILDFYGGVFCSIHSSKLHRTKKNKSVKRNDGWQTKGHCLYVCVYLCDSDKICEQFKQRKNGRKIKRIVLKIDDIWMELIKSKEKGKWGKTWKKNITGDEAKAIMI